MYDFVIIGGGIIDMSTATYSLLNLYPDARIALLEKSPRQPAARPGITAA